jgi:hypothetical protein
MAITNLKDGWAFLEAQLLAHVECQLLGSQSRAVGKIKVVSQNALYLFGINLLVGWK